MHDEHANLFFFSFCDIDLSINSPVHSCDCLPILTILLLSIVSNTLEIYLPHAALCVSIHFSSMKMVRLSKMPSTRNL